MKLMLVLSIVLAGTSFGIAKKASKISDKDPKKAYSLIEPAWIAAIIAYLAMAIVAILIYSTK